MANLYAAINVDRGIILEISFSNVSQRQELNRERVEVVLDLHFSWIHFSQSRLVVRLSRERSTWEFKRLLNAPPTIEAIWIL